MPAFLNIPVAVIAGFDCGRVRPWSFLYSGRRVNLKGVSLLYTEGEGEQRTVYCTAYNDSAVYTLTFKPHDLTWRLVNVSDEDLHQNG